MEMGRRGASGPPGIDQFACGIILQINLDLTMGLPLDWIGAGASKPSGVSISTNVTAPPS
jgi:hypothetical protein